MPDLVVGDRLAALAHTADLVSVLAAAQDYCEVIRADAVDQRDGATARRE
jgi:hypothetical protein